MANTFFGAIVGGVLLQVTSLSAADLSGYDFDQCRISSASVLAGIGNRKQLTGEVLRLMNHAISVAEHPGVVDASRPAFVWASEAKVACGKAFGYLRNGHRDEEYLDKCECFHARMTQYAN